MASPAVLDIASLVEPVTAERPVGVNLREDPAARPLYFQIKDIRTQARGAERQALMNGESAADAGDWQPLLTLVPQALATLSKDLEIAAYLLEALVRKSGFAGLRDGFRLVRELLERYGDEIYPEPDEDGLETRLAPLTGLNGADAEGTLIAPMRSVPLTAKSSVGAFGLAHYRQALDLERATPEQRERRISQGAVALGTIQIAIAESDSDFFNNLRDDLTACQAEFAQLSQQLDGKFGQTSPPTSTIRGVMTECLETLQIIARDKLTGAGQAGTAAAATEQAAAGPASVAPRSGQSVGVIENRDDAFQELLNIAQFFRKTEPHTPISYALEQIVRWGRLPLPELLRELIGDENSVNQMFKLCGIPAQRDTN